VLTIYKLIFPTFAPWLNEVIRRTNPYHVEW
jgi:hypothetical protein